MGNIDRLMKSAQFLAMRITNLVHALSKLYVKDIVRLHGVHSLLSLIEILDLHLSFGNPDRKHWELK